MVSAASFRPLQKTQERGTHSSEMGKGKRNPEKAGHPQSATAYTGYAWGLNGDNSNYSGGFSGFSAGTNAGVFGDRSSGGVTSGPGGLVPSSGPGTVTIVGVNVSASLLGKFSFGLNATNYSKPLQLGSFWAFTTADWSNYLARRVCQ